MCKLILILVVASFTMINVLYYYDIMIQTDLFFLAFF